MGKIIGWSIFGITTLTLSFLGWRKWTQFKKDVKDFVECFAEAVEENEWVPGEDGSVFCTKDGTPVDSSVVMNAAVKKYESRKTRTSSTEETEDNVSDINSAEAAA